MKLVAILQTATEKIDEDHPSHGKNYLVPAVNRQPGYRRGNSQICSTITLSTCYLHTLTSFSGACSEFLMHVVISERSVIFSHIAWCFPLLRCCCPRLSCYVSLHTCCSHIASDIPHALRHLLVCTQHSPRTWRFPKALKYFSMCLCCFSLLCCCFPGLYCCISLLSYYNQM